MEESIPLQDRMDLWYAQEFELTKDLALNEIPRERLIAAYEYAFNESTIPWHICPVDDRWYRDYFIAKTLVEGLEKLNMQFPKPVKT